MYGKEQRIYTVTERIVRRGALLMAFDSLYTCSDYSVRMSSLESKRASMDVYLFDVQELEVLLP